MNLFIESTGKILITHEEYPHRIDLIKLQEYDRARIADVQTGDIPAIVEIKTKSFLRIPYDIHGWTIWRELD